MKLLDLPLPSGKPEAVAAYRHGLELVHDADYGSAHEAFIEATRLDPGMGGAYLRASTTVIMHAPEAARQAFADASRRHATLTAHEKVLLEVFEPLLGRAQPDMLEMARRCDEAIARAPGDADLLVTRARAALMAYDVESYRRAARTLTAVDPTFLDGLQILGDGARNMEDWEAARGAYGECLKVASTSSDCLRGLVLTDLASGDCHAMQDDARTLATVMGPKRDAEFARTFVAAAGGALGRDRPGVEASFATSWKLASAGAKAGGRLTDEIAIAAAFGDFVTARARAEALLADVAPSESLTDHGDAFRLAAEIARETGDTRWGGLLAAAYLDGRDLWTPPFAPRLQSDPVPIAAAMVGAAKGNLTQAADALARWTQAWQSRIAFGGRGVAWGLGWAAATWSEGEALTALAALPTDALMPGAMHQYWPSDAWIGTTFFLGHRTDDALPYLERATKACDLLLSPVAHLRATLFLGEAREQQGNLVGACAAYRTVLDRWGKHTGASITADEAKKRADALHCE